MNAWISPEIAPWFSLTSFVSVLSLLSIFARRGEHRGLVTAVWGAATLVGAACLAATLIGLATGQPWYVLVALGVPGVVMTGVFGWAVLHVQRAYDAAEERRTLAKDL